MPVAVDRAQRWLVLLVLVAGCKPPASKSGGELADDLAQIEAELQRSDARLDDAGIVVAYRDTPASAQVAPPQESPPPASEAEPETPAEPDDSTAPVTPSSPPTIDEPSAAAPVEAEDVSPRMSRSERSRDKDVRRDSRRRAKTSARTRCERVCELTETTCELQERVCTLADDHAGDVRYEDACRRAEDQCEAATRSCESCAV